ncbi:MAG: hypothetical protein L3K03_01840 [Thermoplasmata archaeon]|nr:hypothetical protein [Thermoplasmata archaeon]
MVATIALLLLLSGVTSVLAPTAGTVRVDRSTPSKQVAVRVAPRTSPATPESTLDLSLSASPGTICALGREDCSAGPGESRVTLTAVDSTTPPNGTMGMAIGASVPILSFVPFGNIRLASEPEFATVCTESNGQQWRGGSGSGSNCPPIPVSSGTSGGGSYWGWNWSNNASENELTDGDSWSVSFWVVANGPPFSLVPVDACVAVGCSAAGSSSVGGVYSSATYITSPNSTVTIQSFPVATLQVVYESPPAVTIWETGLPPGTPWSVQVNGSSYTSGTNAISVASNLQNGSYRLTVTPLPGFFLTGYEQPLVVSGATTVTLEWHPFTWLVTFQESGLANGAEWGVRAGTENASSTGDALPLFLPNGTYAFTVGSPVGYETNVTTGEILVIGSVPGYGFLIPFRPTPSYLAGTVMPPSASVRVDNVSVRVVDGSFNATVPPGAHWVVATAPGFEPWSEEVSTSPQKTTEISVQLRPNPSGFGTVNVPPRMGLFASTEVLIALVTLLAISCLLAVATARVRGRARRRGPRAPRP